MSKAFATYQDLVHAISLKLFSLSYCRASVRTYVKAWTKVGSYMKARKIKEYNPEVGWQILEDLVGNTDSDNLLREKLDLVRGVNALSDFVTGLAIRKRKKKTRSFKLEGPIGHVMTEYIEYTKKLNSLAEHTVNLHHLYLSVFLRHLHSNNVHSFSCLKTEHIFSFPDSLKDYSVHFRHYAILKTNKFLSHLSEEHILETDFSNLIRDKYIRNPKLPVYYSKDEILLLLNNIDRANPTGKRDYSMVLLAAMLGLRTSDIVNLELSNITWESEQITLTQKKTKEPVELPLLPVIGNAIIDYLKLGRPESNLPFVFLRHIAPFDKLDDGALHNIVKKYLDRSGIVYNERRHGPHALRHSLATTLLDDEVALPVISGILGHTKLESTMTYTRVDFKSLQKCSLDVPPLF